MMLAFASIRESRIDRVYDAEHESKSGAGARRYVNIHGVTEPPMVFWPYLIQCRGNPRCQSKMRLRRIGTLADLSVFLDRRGNGNRKVDMTCVSELSAERGRRENSRKSRIRQRNGSLSVPSNSIY